MYVMFVIVSQRVLIQLFLVQFYLSLWESVPASPSQKLILTLLNAPGVLDADVPDAYPAPVKIRNWECFLPLFLKFLHENMDHVGSQLVLPSGTWSTELSFETLLTSLTSAIDDQPSDLYAAFDVRLNTGYFVNSHPTRTDRLERGPFAPSCAHGTGILGNVAPPGYARFLDPIGYAGAYTFVKAFSGAAVYLTWPRNNQKNLKYIKSLLRDPAPAKTLNSNRLAITADLIGGMVDGTLMDECRPYYVNRQIDFCLSPGFYLAVIALEPVCFITAPLYTHRSKMCFNALTLTLDLVRRMSGDRYQKAKQHMIGAWEGLEDSTNEEDEAAPNPRLTTFNNAVHQLP